MKKNQFLILSVAHWMLLSTAALLFASDRNTLPARSAGPYQTSVGSHRIDLKPNWDHTLPLPNPHKGWYHHFPDNHPDKYRIGRDSDLKLKLTSTQPRQNVDLALRPALKDKDGFYEIALIRAVKRQTR